MKILAIGRNFVAHIDELNNEQSKEPVVFTKPDTALLLNNKPFYLPVFSNDIHHEVEILVKICRNGKNIEERFSHKYYEEIGIGIDFTARDLQAHAKSKGLPWALAKGFDGSAPISGFVPKTNFQLDDLNFRLAINGTDQQVGNSSKMIFTIDYIIAYLSRFITLKNGDIIFTGTPKGVGPVKIGDRLEAYLEQQKMMDFEVK